MPFGVDEAGKGPVFGSMFAAAVWAPTRDALPDGVADSKRLSPERRETLAETIRADDRIQVGVAEITTERIDAPDTDMNGLAVEAHASALEAAAEELASDLKHRGASEPPVAHCDACDTDADRFARRVADACALETTVEATHGADDDDPLVGAASIVAKVERDAHVAAIADEYGEIGSGYPSDPTTRAFLEEYVVRCGALPAFARASWSTCADVLADAEQTGLEQF
ncbi:ribonuclease HII [Natronosalvus halobius]|uniref:ribonuclease HII n=1 Tax=Natronosalvus halobius TaxID=2953746 RepID=UPI0020A1C70B|nr:ribonuclease HII [Natronosalvus halobius]USZ70902.1 ribonuclease HII [Natronosalvus halobius]